MVAGLIVIVAVVGYGMSQGGPSPSSQAQGASSITVRLAHFPNITHAPALIVTADGSLAKALGSNGLDVKVVNAGPEAMEALLANEIDVAYVGPSPAINTYIKSGGRALRVIAGVCSGGASLVAAEGSGIKELKDLAGKRVATPQLGNTQDVSLRHFMASEGLSPKEKGGQVEILPIKNPDILTQFKQKQLDAAWVPEPWATRIVSEAHASRVIDERKLWPNQQFTTTVIVARTDFLEKHPELVAAIVKANSDAISWTQANPEDAKKTVNEQLKKLTGKALPDAILNESWSFLDFTTDPNPTCFEAFLSAATECGYVKAPPKDLDALFYKKANP